jgi:hypothetical protein
MSATLQPAGIDLDWPNPGHSPSAGTLCNSRAPLPSDIPGSDGQNQPTRLCLCEFRS